MEPIAPAAPTPAQPVRHFGMWISFEYILMFICLYVSFTALGGILNLAVDKYVPNATDSFSSGMVSLQTSILPGYLAAMLVTYPIFAFFYYHLNKQVLNTPDIKSLRSRKLLMYLTLVITFIIVISQLIGTLYGFFQGTSTMNTALHFSVTLLVAGSVFVYLLADVRGDRNHG